MLPDVWNGAITQNIMCAVQFLMQQKKELVFFFCLSNCPTEISFKGIYFCMAKCDLITPRRVGRYGLLFSRGRIWNACSTTSPERRPLKRVGQDFAAPFSSSRPNLRFIIVPQPCRKRSVTLGGRPAKPTCQISPFTLPVLVLWLLPSRFQGDACCSERKAFDGKTIYQSLFSQNNPSCFFLVFFHVPVSFSYGYDNTDVEHAVITTSPLERMYTTVQKFGIT